MMLNISGRMMLSMTTDKMVTLHHGFYYTVYLRTISNNCRRHFYHFDYHGTTRPQDSQIYDEQNTPFSFLYNIYILDIVELVLVLNIAEILLAGR
jgi:hypothetical protein